MKSLNAALRKPTIFALDRLPRYVETDVKYLFIL